MSAAAIQGDLQQGVVNMGQNGRKMQWGSFTFPTTDATATLKVQMNQVEAVILTPWGAPASDEIAYWADTVNTNGLFQVPATGVVTVGRTGASKTSALPVGYLIIGK